MDLVDKVMEELEVDHMDHQTVMTVDLIPTRDSDLVLVLVQDLANLNMLVVDLQLALDQKLLKDLVVIVIMMIPVKLVNGESKRLMNLRLQNLKDIP